MVILNVDDIELRLGWEEKPPGGKLGIFVENTERYIRFEYVCKRIVNGFFYTIWYSFNI